MPVTGSTASEGSMEAQLFAADQTPFVASSSWTVIQPGQSVPPGLWMRMDIATGLRMARLMPTEEERAAAGDLGPTTVSTAEDQRPQGVRDDDFDESQPTDDEGTTEATFFVVYGPVFERNAVFSNRRSVPQLGNMSSAVFQINEFYEFWNNFSSCRLFPDDDADSSSVPASNRAQRQRDNEKKQQNARRNDTTRIRQLAASAYKKDPRVARIKREAEDALNAKLAIKQAEAAAKEAKQLELAAEAAAAKAAAQQEREAAEAAAAQREAESRLQEEEAKKQLRESHKKTRAAFGKLCRAADMDLVHIDYLRASLTPEQLLPMVEAFTADEQSSVAKEIFATHLAALLAVEQAAADVRAQAAAAAQAAKELRDAEANWTPEEHAMLAKAIARYPHGTPLRWHKVCELVNTIAIRTRELADVVARSHALEAQQGAQRADDFQKYRSALKGSQHTEDAASQEIATPASSASGASSSPAPSAASSVDASASPSPPPDAVSSPSSSSSASSAGPPFSEHEQQLFEFGLRNIPKTSPDRWEQIAGIVGTKTKEQCQARFKIIVAHIKAEKQRRQ